MLQPIIILVTKVIINNFIESLLSSTPKLIIENHANFISYFLEEINYLAENSEYNHRNKIKLISFIRNHLNTCVDPECGFKKGTEFDNYI